MRVIYRISDSGYNKVKPDYINNEACLANAIDKFPKAYWDIIADNVFDKAISAGEKTKLKIDDLRISSSGIGIASKDSSEVYASNIKITNCKISDFAVFQKKEYFSGGFLKADKVSSCNLSIVQKGSNLSVNGKKIDGKIINIKKLYDGML